MDPQTTNVGLSVPVRGSNIGTWDTPVNADFSAIDGYFGGVLTLSLSNANIVLTAPAGFTSAPSPGPVQSQNGVLHLTGTVTANLVITLPVPGYYIVDTTDIAGNPQLIFLQGFLATGGDEAIAIPQGMVTHVYTDGHNVRFANLGPPGRMEFWAGVSAVPGWVTACTRQPYLPCSGGIFNYTPYGALGRILSSQFGGNGSTTFGVPDLRGRVPLALDTTGTRITTAGSGVNGQVIASVGGVQNQTIAQFQLPSLNWPVSDPGHFHIYALANSSGTGIWPGGGSQGVGLGNTNTVAAVTGIVVSSGGSGLPVPIVQPSQVAGIWVIKT